MSLNLNKAIISGRLTSDPELKSTTSGLSVSSFTVAINRPKPKDGGEQQADFINCVAWRSTADFITKYFKKGSAICIVGAIRTRSWTDNNGQKRYATEVVADEANFVESKSDAPAQQSVNTKAAEYKDTSDASNFVPISPDDDLPF